MKTLPLVSVVTPFYNTEKFLGECIESVLRQSYLNWQYVLVDNCSTDQSGAIAQRYAREHPEKIRVVRTETFLSQVENYNFALAEIDAESKYCKMVQADDWLFPDCIRSMVELAEEHPRVGIVAAYELEGDEVRLDGLPYPSPEVTGREAAGVYFVRGKYLFGTPTSLLFRSDLVRSRKPFFDERYAPFEDGHACFDLLKTCNFGFVHQVLTYTRRDNDSIISRVRPFGLELFLRYSLLAVHGRDFLSPEIFDLRMKEARREYLSFLSGAACARHRESREFWQFHRKGLASIGETLDWQLLWSWIPRTLMERTWAGAWRAWDRITN